MYVVQAEKFCLLSKGFYAEISEKTMNGIKSRSQYLENKVSAQTSVFGLYSLHNIEGQKYTVRNLFAIF